MLSWVGCRVASPNPDAVHIELAMTPPQSYPFIKQADHLSKHEKHFWSRVSTDGLTDQQIEAYLKDGYEWDYDVKASFYLYFRSKESPGWSLAKPYSLSYELNGTYLIPDKLESYQSSGYYGESQTVLFPTKDTAVQLLILIVPKDASLPRKQFIWDCSREQFGKIEKNKGFRILFLNYAFFYPLLTVPLPLPAPDGSTSAVGFAYVLATCTINGAQNELELSRMPCQNGNPEAGAIEFLSDVWSGSETKTAFRVQIHLYLSYALLCPLRFFLHFCRSPLVFDSAQSI